MQVSKVQINTGPYWFYFVYFIEKKSGSLEGNEENDNIFVVVIKNVTNA